MGVLLKTIGLCLYAPFIFLKYSFDSGFEYGIFEWLIALLLILGEIFVLVKLKERGRLLASIQAARRSVCGAVMRSAMAHRQAQPR